MGQDLQTSADAIRSATRRTLEVADELGCSTVALPAFGTGIGGFALDEAATLMVGIARGFRPRALREIVFAVYGDDARRAFEQALARPGEAPAGDTARGSTR
jgi:O-acetyl-ADP-ribose deacetylase (regulator of RNase III)